MTTTNRTTIGAALTVVKELSTDPAPILRYTDADLERLIAESATWPLPTFTGDEARRAIEASGFRFCDRCHLAIVEGSCGCREKVRG